MSKYPGLGFPLRHNPQENNGHYPIGAHGSCYGSHSDMLPIRELAMMAIMDRLTDKEDWHKKVFNDGIVSKWREEALAIPDDEFNRLATGYKEQWWENGKLTMGPDNGAEHIVSLEGVVTEKTFNVVCSTPHLLLHSGSKPRSVSKNSGVKPGTSNKPV